MLQAALQFLMQFTWDPVQIESEEQPDRPPNDERPRCRNGSCWRSNSIYLSRSLRLTGSDLEAAECKDELLSLNDFLEVTAIRASASVHASH